MKSPINFYGGKVKMLKHILPLIPKHSIYTEAFAGSLAVFFAKERVKTEIVNDTNAFIPNFYSTLVNDFDTLKAKIDGTLYSRATYTVALCIYRIPHLFNSVQKAWAFFVLTNVGFSGKIGSFGCYTIGTKAQWFQGKKELVTKDLAKRFEGVQIENTDALKILKLRDVEGESWHYVDPPYFNSHCGDYEGYSEKDFTNLLSLLSTLKGKFLLSSYPSEILSQYTSKFGWYNKEIQAKVSASNTKIQKGKTEVLTANYPIQ
ncbi:MAG: DNA adenine methylase [Crocinitomicaceae bacterium]|jgi:DNA adenine methylase